MLAKISGALACAVLMAGLSQPTFARGKPEEDMHMKVTDLKMVSTSCQ